MSNKKHIQGLINTATENVFKKYLKVKKVKLNYEESYFSDQGYIILDGYKLGLTIDNYNNYESEIYSFMPIKYLKKCHHILNNYFISKYRML